MGQGWLGKGWLRSLVCFGAALGLVLGGSGMLPLLATSGPDSGAKSGAGALLAVPNRPAPVLAQFPPGDEELITPEAVPITPPRPLIPTDIQSHWAQDCITALAQTGLVTADSNGLFYPDEPILWGDYVAWLNQISPPAQSGSWANPLEAALGIATAPTVASHYPAQYFQRDRPLVRAEAIMALAAKLGGNYQIAANTIINASLEDGRQVPEYAREGVATGLVLGVVVNYPQGNRLNPTQRLTRGEAAALVCRAAPNPELRRWMNPFHPQVQKFMLELINDLVANYDIDGFQFDDHLGLPVEFGYDPYTINLYRAEHNGQEPPIDPQNPEWMAWRANKISDFLSEVHKLVAARRPNAVVSISPNPYPFAYVHYLQDWPEWVNRGIVDELVVQLYRSDQNRFMWELNKPSIEAAERKIPVAIGILSGLRADPVKMSFITDQMAAVRDRAYAGMSFFFYESLWVSPTPETATQRTDQLQQAFATPAQRPGRS